VLPESEAVATTATPASPATGATAWLRRRLGLRVCGAEQQQRLFVPPRNLEDVTMLASGYWPGLLPRLS
jgi:hypothetical protein